MTSSVQIRWRVVILLSCGLSFSYDIACGQVLSPLLRTPAQATIKQASSPLEPPAVSPQYQAAFPANVLLQTDGFTTIASGQTINPTVLAPSARKGLPRGFMLVSPARNVLAAPRNQKKYQTILH
ncbi:hypothetical protein WOC76_14315 [Methylocystis sp. IM3]|uniref:hypothetical protein n=1 Tax=unclassified Methylocystis TaxID=2625913 RepID=UPI000F91BC13|nr:MAG: hypothetical protein EKK29_01495 [Hyphomicrobiales bacterium]